MNIIHLAGAGDILHRGDIIGVRYDIPRSWVQNRIVAYQRDYEMIDHPINEISHVLVVTSAKRWIGYEMQPPHGNSVEITKAYHRCQLWVMRYEGWEDDETRYAFVDRAIYLSNVNYSWGGCLRFLTGFFPTVGRFCSQLIEDASAETNVNGGKGFCNEPGKDVTPARICTAKMLRHVATIYCK